jgi:Protein of unknown function (DUF3168)
MSSDPSLSLQKALVAALKGNTAAGENVYDMVPQSNLFPRITLGSCQALGDTFRADCIAGSEVYLDLDVWSRAVGYPEAKTIADQVRGILDDADLPLDGHHVELMLFESVTFERDPDGLTSRGRMLFRALTQPL